MVKNFEDLLNMPKEPRPLNPEPLPELRHLAFNHVSFQHQTASSPALTDISFDVTGGDTIAFVGPSGSGKTTLLRVIAGLEGPDTGTVKYDDEVVTDLPVRERNVGFVFQHYALFRHMTIAQNISFPLRQHTKKTPAEIERISWDLVLPRGDCSQWMQRQPRNGIVG
jgi:ABC-type Fe3+/spermidine/putrescine transport system ATPase subunit